jgi:hypothetical protein
MPLIVTRTYARPSIEIPWHFDIIDPSPYLERILSYNTEEKQMDVTIEHSPDGLSFTYRGVWANEQAWTEYDTDSILKPYWEVVFDYYKVMGVVVGAKEFLTI